MNSTLNIDHGAPVEAQRAARLLQRWAGLALPDHRWPLLRSELVRLASDGTVASALDRLEAGDRAAKRALLAGITVPETYLFRHPSHFEALSEHALAAAAGPRQAGFRVLSAGCATGEEAWSAAAVLDEVERKSGLRWQVIGWELDASRIARARAGHYSAWSARAGLSGYEGAFEPRGEGWSVRPHLRGRVSFDCVNLKLKPAPELAPFDVVFLRNVAIYWAPDCATEMVDHIASLVAPGGLLLMGASEPEALDRSVWQLEWRGFVRIATRRSSTGVVLTLPRSSPSDPVRVPLAHARPRAKDHGSSRQRSAPRPRLARPAAAPILAPAVPPPPVHPCVPPSCSPPLEQIRALADRGRYLGALAILDALPPSPEAERYLWRGILYLNLARLADALDSLRKAVFLAPSELSCRRWLALALTACGQHEAAAREHRNLRELSA